MKIDSGTRLTDYLFFPIFPNFDFICFIMADLEHNEVQHQLAQSSRITNPQSLKTEQCLLNSS